MRLLDAEMRSVIMRIVRSFNSEALSMLLQKRLMWPKLGEKIEVLTEGKLTAQGLVTNVNSDNISVLTPDMTTILLDCQSLEHGIEDRSIVVRKTR